ncbi:6-phosphogluconolactonase [Magnaporthiopsis poae ATCC 64411]|uniref:6-phosphogluconolactonase n=1 Tax=Magnaporthiopsis poae (strain ATCC 64411 / 73-15) TaxID=644358 RepID=A0A0C4E275_MAGP6|nr:6-phosphogluconolactonase [Magnaporthiopsis poae ATCC 64411]
MPARRIRLSTLSRSRRGLQLRWLFPSSRLAYHWTAWPVSPFQGGELADNYEQALVGSFASRDSVKLPIFDLLLLGCGPDGHTCSLFPGHELLRETSAWVAPIEDSPKPPPRRITLTLPVVTHSVRVAFVATGAGKRDVMKEIFDGDGGLPCALVNQGAGDRCSWFVDNSAVEGVSFPKRNFNL